MKNVVIEMQNGVVLSTIHPQEEIDSGIDVADFHQRCAAAAVSSVENHVIMLVQADTGYVFESKSFHHPVTE